MVWTNSWQSPSKRGLAVGGIPIGPVPVLDGIGGVEPLVADGQECRTLMAEFIRARPELWNEDIEQ
jgi:hypothetical protein